VEVVDGIAHLVAKSLVTLVAGGTVARYRLLDTIRAYALEKLAERATATGSRAATPTITAACFSTPKPRHRGLRPIG
jgi:predicted ATPase